MSEQKPLVLLESPYAGAIERNTRYARACLRDCLMRGEAPIASHLLYTQDGVLDDQNKAERELGMRAGWAWFRAVDRVVVYMDLGETAGMKAGITRALKAGKPVERRTLGSALGEPPTGTLGQC